MSLIYCASGTDPDNPITKSRHDELAESPSENTNGVISIKFNIYGDAPEVPYIKVWATNLRVAVQVYKLAHELKTHKLFNPPIINDNQEIPEIELGMDILTDHIDYVQKKLAVANSDESL